MMIQFITLLEVFFQTTVALVFSIISDCLKDSRVILQQFWCIYRPNFRSIQQCKITTIIVVIMPQRYATWRETVNIFPESLSYFRNWFRFILYQEELNLNASENSNSVPNAVLFRLGTRKYIFLKSKTKKVESNHK